MEKSFEKGIVLDLKSLIEYSEGGVISKQLIKSTAGNITLFSFDKGEGLSEHTAPFDALVQIYRWNRRKHSLSCQCASCSVCRRTVQDAADDDKRIKTNMSVFFVTFVDR